MKGIALLGYILNALNTAYSQGACDNITDEELSEVLGSFEHMKDIFEKKQNITYTTEQASRYLNVTRQTINNYVKAGKLHPKKQLGGVLQFDKQELDDLIKKSKNK